MNSHTDFRSEASRLARINRLLDELNQRRVGRATTVYAIGLWLSLQLADIGAPLLGLPEWTMTLLVTLGLIGLPVVIALAWMFQVTRRGVMLDLDIPRRRAIEPPGQPRVAVDATLLGLALVLTVLTSAQLAG
jgi:hypothetical protein